MKKHLMFLAGTAAVLCLGLSSDVFATSFCEDIPPSSSGNPVPPQTGGACTINVSATSTSVVASHGASVATLENLYDPSYLQFEVLQRDLLGGGRLFMNTARIVEIGYTLGNPKLPAGGGGRKLDVTMSQWSDGRLTMNVDLYSGANSSQLVLVEPEQRTPEALQQMTQELIDTAACALTAKQAASVLMVGIRAPTPQGTIVTLSNPDQEIFCTVVLGPHQQEALSVSNLRWGLITRASPQNGTYLTAALLNLPRP